MQNSKLKLRGGRERTGNRIGSSPVCKLQNMCTSIHPQLCIMRKKNNYVYYLPILPLLTNVVNFLAPCLHPRDQHWLWFFLLVWKVADKLDS